MRAHCIQVNGESAQGDLTCEAGHRLTQPAGSTDGVYADGAGRAVRWTSNRIGYGFFPLFEWRTADTRVVCTDIAALLKRGAPADIDLDAMAVFLRVGFFVGADTPFRAIRAVLPPELPRVRLEISGAAAVEGFIELFKSAIARRLPSAPYELPLSGGRDSRHILSRCATPAMSRWHASRFAISPPGANDDELVARRLAPRWRFRTACFFNRATAHGSTSGRMPRPTVLRRARAVCGVVGSPAGAHA